MEFEWDDEKRLNNLAKHGFDFQRAAELFDGRPVVEIQSTYLLEVRFKTDGPTGWSLRHRYLDAAEKRDSTHFCTESPR